MFEWWPVRIFLPMSGWQLTRTLSEERKGSISRWKRLAFDISTLIFSLSYEFSFSLNEEKINKESFVMDRESEGLVNNVPLVPHQFCCLFGEPLLRRCVWPAVGHCKGWLRPFGGGGERERKVGLRWMMEERRWWLFIYKAPTRAGWSLMGDSEMGFFPVSFLFFSFLFFLSFSSFVLRFTLAA